MKYSRLYPSHSDHPHHISSLLVISVLVSVVGGQVAQNDRKTLEAEYMYDYYNYPQMFDESEGEQFQKNDIPVNIEDEGFQHVTYVNNGAVISNSKSNRLSVPGVTSAVTSEVTDDVTVASAEIIDHLDDHHQSDAQTEEDAIVFLNPQFGGGNNQLNPFQSPAIDFDETLSGMMGALAEIQKKGDTMLGSIRRQKGVLDQLDTQVSAAERRRQEAETQAQQLEDVKLRLEAVVLDLEKEREDMITQMKQEEFEMAKIKTDLAPLLSEVSQRKSELLNFENSINTKKSELENYQQEIDKVSKNLSELKNGAVGVTVDGSSAVATGSFVTFALVISVIFNILVGGYVLSQLAAAERMDNKVSQFVGAADTALADSITGFLEGFEGRFPSSLDRQSQYDDFRPSEKEYYAYSELPRSAY